MLARVTPRISRHVISHHVAARCSSSLPSAYIFKSCFLSFPVVLPHLPSSSHSRSLFTSPSLFSSSSSFRLTSSSPPSSYPPGYTGKQFTGMAGLDVIPNAKEVLIGLYEETINIAKAYGSNNYNDYIIKLCNYRLRLVRENETNEEIEDAIAAGVIEELVEQAENELDLLVTMNEEIKPWQPDPEGDAEFAATDYPLFGETPENHDLTIDESCWEEIDKQIADEKQQQKKKLTP